MNRTDRLLAIVLELQSKGRQRAEDLAATFETSKRTIYRDIEALSEAGVPLLAVPGLGYELMAGYFLPPLSFSTDEASMLLLGSEFIAQNFDTDYQQAAQSASRKIAGVLPEQLREEVRDRQSNIRLISQFGGDLDTLKILRRAVIEHRTVQFCYHGRTTAEPESQREADPYGMIYIEGAWYIRAYCHLRQDIRSFRLERMSELKLTARVFARPPDFKLAQTESEVERKIIVRVHFESDIVRWVRESRNFYVVDEAEQPQGLLVTLRVRHERDVLNWILGWGSRAQVLEPASLRKMLVEEATKLIEQYKNS